MADIEDSEARQRGRGERRPDSVANIVRPDSVANIGSIVKPDSVANIGNIVRPDSVANIGNIVRPDSVADVRPVQAVAERKHERKGAGAEVEEARAG